MCGKTSMVFLFSVTLLLLSQATHAVELDCFSVTLKYEQFNVDFYISSRNKRNQLYNLDTAFIPQQYDFDPSRRTIVLVHGFFGDVLVPDYIKLTNSLIKWQNTNVINVEWIDGSSYDSGYPQTVVNTEYTAIQIQRLFNTLIKIYQNTEKSPQHWGPIHIIGDGLGAHVAGQAARLLKSQNNLTVARVTGLDPTEPCFQQRYASLRLKRSDATFVDVVHTDATTKDEQGFGLREPIGDVDFYVNGGDHQPGCEDPLPESNMGEEIADFPDVVQHAFLYGVCHHQRAILLFRETVRQASKNGCKFLARPWTLDSTPDETKEILEGQCTSCVEMGILAENHHFTSKIYYLPTTNQPPYCQN